MNEFIGMTNGFGVIGLTRIMPKTRPPLLRRGAILWKHYERQSRKGYINRDIFVDQTRYNFLSARVTPEGIEMFYMRDLNA